MKVMKVSGFAVCFDLQCFDAFGWAAGRAVALKTQVLENASMEKASTKQRISQG